MRVIRTELFFDTKEIGSIKTLDDEASVSVAWSTLAEKFNGPSEELLEELVNSGVATEYFSIPSSSFLDATLAQAEIGRDMADPNIIRPLYYPKILKEVEQERIVIEHSPPITEPLNSLLAKATPIAGGLYLGIHLANGETI